MAETSTMNSDNKMEQDEKKQNMKDIKTEVELSVKREPLECVVCTIRNLEVFDMYVTNTSASGVTLHDYIAKFAQFDFTNAQNCSKYICKTCYELVNVLEQAEIEYNKLKNTFVAILNKNPLFGSFAVQPIRLNDVKAEIEVDIVNNLYNCDAVDNDDSDDEPLATQSKKKRHKVVKKKKSITASSKHKTRSKNSDSWKCDECNTKGSTGGTVALAAHKLEAHALGDSNVMLQDVKTEDSMEGSQSPIFNNGFENGLKMELDVTFGEEDDSLPDTGDDFFEDTKSNKKLLLRRGKSKTIQGRKKKVKVMHQCDQCDAKYSSNARLEQHKRKHDGSKPPYICEVCGAHYKHKRACDIHIALHKGISDWKCEECNKLFPSKNALQRHNNIHTGKLNYQCDLCGKSFIHTSSFKMHKLSHSGVKPHACDVCGLALMTRSHLKRHKRVHSGEKRHECGVCGKRFSERYNLAAHSKAHDAPGPAVTLPPRRRLFRCTFCVERFERRYMLERHMSVVHGRTLERPPPTPRNTMSKLLKAQAQRRDAPAPPPPEADTKDDVSSDSRTPSTPITPQKLIAQLATSTSVIAQSAWNGSYAEFSAAFRHDYPH